ncbi:MAG: response regulator [Pseudomonadota bacterium]
MDKSANAPTYVVDDQKLVRSTIETILTDVGLEVQSFPSGVDFLDAQPGLTPGAVFLDVRMPQLDGLGVLTRLRQVWPDEPVIMISGHADVPMAVSAMRSGASYFLEKPFSRDAIEMVVDSVLRGGSKPEPEADDTHSEHLLSSLTDREIEVLQCLVRGDRNKKIAQDLGISPRTVEVHRAKLMLKLGTKSFAELIKIALASGIEKR